MASAYCISITNITGGTRKLGDRGAGLRPARVRHLRRVLLGALERKCPNAASDGDGSLYFRPRSPGYPGIAMSLMPGTRLGSYQVTALISQGGMGEVYQARRERRSESRCQFVVRSRAIEIGSPGAGLKD